MRKLKNKKTGETVNAVKIDLSTDVVYLRISRDGRYDAIGYDSLDKLNEEWEDVPEESKGIKNIYFIGATVYIEMYNQKEAIEVEEKLKAFKRLEDKGFRFVEHQIHGMTEDGEGDGCTYFEFDKQLDKSDLDLLFGGEE